MKHNEKNGAKENGSPHQYGKIKILMLHRVVTDEKTAEKYWFCLHVKKFRKILELLDQWGYVPITMEDYRLYCKDEITLPKRPVILSFDDGYADTYENAFPLLGEYGMKAVVFALGDRTIQYNLWDKELSGANAPLLSDHQILEMSDAGIEIGAHSMTHVKLTQLDKDALWYEISQSRVLLEILLNKPVRTFSYPYGLVNEMVKKFVRYAGYTHACGVWSGPAMFGEDNFELRRIPVVNSTNELELIVKLSSPYQYFRWLVWKAKEKIDEIEHPHGIEKDFRTAPLENGFNGKLRV